MDSIRPGVTIRVHGVKYDLRFVNGTEDGELHGVNNGKVAWPDGSSPIIKIDANAPLDAQREALFHELIHVADMETAAGDGMEEPVVKRLARYLYGIARDNPFLFAWIFPQEEK